VKKGFTLIELLIVVAIIAILAAIAVPNFMEAQIRARVSRVKTDLRTVAVGIEAFQVDYNVYPVCLSGGKGNINDGLEHAQGSNIDLRVTFADLKHSKIGKRNFTLTTPVSYLQTIPSDSFADTNNGNFGYANLNELGWLIWSYGPNSDEMEGSEIDHALKNCETWSATKWRQCTTYNPGKSNPTPELQWITYDPTNGSVSAGDIWKMM
jgi:prepilin-type N-terminal cleavage/methylation domain-containing protein